MCNVKTDSITKTHVHHQVHMFSLWQMHFANHCCSIHKPTRPIKVTVMHKSLKFSEQQMHNYVMCLGL